MPPENIFSPNTLSTIMANSKYTFYLHDTSSAGLSFVF